MLWCCASYSPPDGGFPSVRPWRRPGNTIDLLRAQEKLLRDQIAARTLTLERVADASQEFDDATDEEALADLRANAESVKEQRADFVVR